jgi:hypothetical protein
MTDRAYDIPMNNMSPSNAQILTVNTDEDTVNINNVTNTNQPNNGVQNSNIILPRNNNEMIEARYRRKNFRRKVAKYTAITVAMLPIFMMACVLTGWIITG